MSGKRKPSPESSLTLISPNALLLSSPFCTYPFYGDDDRNSSKNNGGTSFLKLNQQKIKELTKSTKIVQRPQKQKAVLSTRSKTFDSIPPSLEVNNNPFPPSSSPFDYDSVHSPGGVSNASSEGPTYVRTPGFEHHAQEFEIQRKRQQCSKSHAPFASRVDEQLNRNDPEAACGQEHVRSSSKASQNGSVSNATSKKKKSVVFGTSDGKHETEAVKKTDPSQQTTSKHKPKKGTFYRLFFFYFMENGVSIEIRFHNFGAHYYVRFHVFMGLRMRTKVLDEPTETTFGAGRFSAVNINPTLRTILN